jgi:NAD(P)-dependent dehydrogenase (short-subunit alcohol dehydrogenase family)
VALETRPGHHRQRDLPGYVWTPLVEKQIPDTMKARGMTKEQVINDVLLAAQPTKEFVTVEQVAALAVFLTGAMLPMTAAQITGGASGHEPADRRRLDRAPSSRR